jgi:hypothetical protein
MRIPIMITRASSLLAGLIALAAVMEIHTGAVAAPELSRRDGESFMRKVGLIAQQALSRTAGDRRVMVTEDELNGFLSYQGAAALPAGVLAPRVTLIGQGRMVGQAIIDLEALRQTRYGSLVDRLSAVAGQLPVSVLGTLQTGDGLGRFDLESLEVSGVPVPKDVVVRVLAQYSRSSQHPDGINLDEPFSLPANIRQIDVSPGQAIIVQ